MIQSISNITQLAVTDQTGSKPQVQTVLSKSDTIVLVEVLDKSANNYKLLVNGKLFQAILPFECKIGEEFLANVLRQSPFTLSLDKLTGLTNLNGAELKTILLKFGLGDKPIIKEFLKKISDEGKPLLKSKLRRLVDLLQETDCQPDDHFFMFLVNMVWEEKREADNGEYKELLQILNISFYDLCKAICESYQLLKSMNIRDSLLSRFSGSFVLEDLNGAANYDIIKDKSDRFYDLIKLINLEIKEPSLTFMQSEELIVFRNLLLRYILQKAVYVQNGENPEFCALKTADGLKALIFDLNKSIDSMGNNCFIVNSQFPDNGEVLDIRLFYSDEKISGRILTGAARINEMIQVLESFNKFLFDSRKLSSNIITEIKLESISSPATEIKKKIKTVNSCA